MQTIRIGHSPDPTTRSCSTRSPQARVRIPGVRIEHVLEDIETLNRRSREAELEVTAVSFATYLLIADRYRMMDPGASMGKGYGPILVAREPVPPAELEQRVTAIAGKHTTSALLLRLYVGDRPSSRLRSTRSAGGAGRTGRPGLLIHEGQITYQTMGLTKVLDWARRGTRTPGCRCRSGATSCAATSATICTAPSRRPCGTPSLAHAHVDEALEYAMRYGRGIDKETCRRFVLMYVNDFTLALGPEGRAAVERLFTMAHQNGAIPTVPPIDPI